MLDGSWNLLPSNLEQLQYSQYLLKSYSDSIVNELFISVPLIGKENGRLILASLVKEEAITPFLFDCFSMHFGFTSEQLDSSLKTSESVLN